MDNEIVAAVIYVILAFVLISIAILIFVYYSGKKVMRAKLQQKQLEIDYEKNLSQATILLQEKERSRIAKELHDGVNAQVNLISLNANALKEMELTTQEKEELLDRLIAQCGNITGSIRRVIHDLLPPVLEKFGLVRAIEELCYELNAAGKTEVRFSANVQPEGLDHMHSLYVYRIIQELTNNSIIHGNAQHITIEFEQEAHRYLCLYTDDGTGFDLEEALKRSGLGLKNIKSRLTHLQSDLLVVQNEAGGVMVKFNF